MNKITTRLMYLKNWSVNLNVYIWRVTYPQSFIVQKSVSCIFYVSNSRTFSLK